MDTGPLITLAAAEALDYLLIPEMPVIIPDAVFYEATNKTGALGASSIADWTLEHVHDVQIVGTVAYASHVAMLEAGIDPPKDVGERAALEVGRDTTLVFEGEACFLLIEDDRVIRGGFILPDDRGRIEVISTYDFLLALEQAQRINSLDAVYRRSEDAGRAASKKQTAAEQRNRSMAALETVMQAQVRKSKL